MIKYKEATKDLYAVIGTYDTGKWFFCKLRMDTPEEGEFTDSFDEALSARDDIQKYFPAIKYHVKHIAV